MHADALAIEHLAQYRLRRDLTYKALAVEMAAAGYPIKQRTLHLALTESLDGLPQERTRFKIREFVAALDAQAAKRRKARRAKKARPG